MTKKPKPLRERDIEKYLVGQVKKLGGEVRKVEWIGRTGAPDRLVMLPGRCPRVIDGKVHDDRSTLWVELKAPGEKPEAHQHREHTRMRKMGQRVEVVDSFLSVDLVLGVK